MNHEVLAKKIFLWAGNIEQEWNSEVLYYDLSVNWGWRHYGWLSTNWARSRWISLTPYEAYLAGGNTFYGESTRYVSFLHTGSIADILSIVLDAVKFLKWKHKDVNTPD
jgi:hypothetical protein